MDFKDTKKAFRHKTTKELKGAAMLFKSFNYPVLIKYGPGLASWAMSWKLPVKGIIKNTLFAWFCGGERIDECEKTIKNLSDNKVGTILDYSVEGADDEHAFDETATEIIRTIEKAASNAKIPFSVFKTTGLVKNELLEKVSNNSALEEMEQQAYSSFETRFERICKSAFQHNVRLFVDAEESWLQDAIDAITYKMMERYNTKDIIIFNTLQLYRHDRLTHLKECISTMPFKQGYKLVRGAYLEKENKRALDNGYPTPIQPNKEATDTDYNAAMLYCLEHLEKVAFSAGTHNEESSALLAEKMIEKGISKTHPHIWFAQLLGMSDHISFNLADAGFNVAKYVPYGPVQSVLPYLARRAQENSGMKGQMGRELSLINEELERRRKAT